MSTLAKKQTVDSGRAWQGEGCSSGLLVTSDKRTSNSLSGKQRLSWVFSTEVHRGFRNAVLQSSNGLPGEGHFQLSWSHLSTLRRATQSCSSSVVSLGWRWGWGQGGTPNNRDFLKWVLRTRRHRNGQPIRRVNYGILEFHNVRATSWI